MAPHGLRTSLNVWVLVLVALSGCTYSTSSRSTPPPSRSAPFPAPAWNAQQPQPVYAAQPPAPYPAQPPAPLAPQYQPTGSAGGFCAALRQRAAACPTESVRVNGCDHDERCLAGLGRADVNSAIVDCILRSPCNVAGKDIARYCLAAAKSRVLLTPLGSRLAADCAPVVARCPGGRVVDKCESAHLLTDPVAQQVLYCLTIPDCRQKDRCIERVFEVGGCP